MKHIIKRLSLSVLACVFFSTIGLAEEIYLKNGELIKGKITKITSSYISLESELGYGQIDIPKEQVINILFPEASRIDLARRYGIGYLHRAVETSSADRYNYQVNQLSFRTYFTTDIFLDFLLGYNSSQYVNSTTQQKETFSSFQSGVRMAHVFYGRSNASIYAGASLGVIAIEDSLKDLDESGVAVSAFVGVELFFPSLPDFGFSGEVALTSHNTKSLQRNDLSILALPTLSVHYYF
ncbi:MAG: hypothetical protein JJV97_06365 [SAR324 cluster bacterium]|nr:hypothetical protein [SAR324 cluster bacterium]